MGWEVKIDISGQSKDCLWVCNVKMKKKLLGQKRGTFPWIFGFSGHSVERFENFFMAFGVPISLTVADIFQPISTRSRWGTWMHNAHGCISGLILHGAFQTKFLGILYHKLSTIMLIRRSAGCFKCEFGILGNYFIMVGRHIMVLL